MGKGIISNIRLCVYFKKYSNEEIRYVKQFILFNTNRFFIRDLCIGVQVNNKTLYLPPQSPKNTIATNNSIAVKFNNKYYLFPTNTTAFSTGLTVQIVMRATKFDRIFTSGYLQLSKGGNTNGLNYKIKWEVLEYDYNTPIQDFELSVADSWSSIEWKESTGLGPGSINKIRLSCEASDDYFDFTVNYGQETCTLDNTYTFNLKE